MAFNSFNSPFWSFFDNINDEVDNFNRVLASNGFGDRVKVSPPSKKTITEGNNDNKQIAETNNAASRSSNSLIFPSLFNSPIFGSTAFDVVPPVDILDKKDNYELHVSVPGAEKDKINLEFNADKNEIVVSGEIPGHSDGDDLKVNERSSGKFERHITLPAIAKLDEENIKATYEKGVLILKVPKLANDKSTSRRIEISSSESWSSSNDGAAASTKAA